MYRLGKELGAEQTGASLYELPPGSALCPYHYDPPSPSSPSARAGSPTPLSLIRTSSPAAPPDAATRTRPLDPG